ncbi:hypothetical protein SAMN04488038_109207 [Solimonas aquatica]|uniref:Uncharacterized protein n=1 Tax=Solimonas aquatica TaxID=489703 RepID=A0A1H9I6X5_9GAMM|nr:hypothetical protein [Solimonas aquatica]SEQ70327.1 hypothetical protein SAMN04488038_109207 [Solimonas aquatica]
MKKQHVFIAAVITTFCSSAFAGPLNLLGISGSHSGSNTTTLKVNPLGAVTNLTSNLASRLNQSGQTSSSDSSSSDVGGTGDAGSGSTQRVTLLGSVFGLTSGLTSRLQQSLKLNLSHSGSSDLVVGDSNLHTFADWGVSGANGFTTTFGSSSSSSF